MPVLREQRRREFASHYWGPTTFFSKNAGRWTESGALERERRSWTSDRSSSPPAGGGAGDRDDRPVAELHLGLEARSPSAAGVKSTSAYSPGRTYGASSTFGNVVSLADVSVASRSTMASSSSFGYEPARFGFVDEPRSSSSSARGFSFGGGEARELNFVSKPAQQQQQHHGHHQQQHRQQQAGRSSPGPFAEATAFGSETDPGERDSDLEIGVLRSDWRAASGGSSGVGARQPGAASTSTAQQQQQHPVGAVAVPGGGGSAGGGGGDAQSPPMSSGAPCGACKFLRRKCVRGCIFAPYFGAEQGAARFAAVHKIFGASNVSKLLLHIPLPKRCDAVLTISYEAQARISDPVYGCVATIFALQQQVASLQAELAMVQSQLTSRLAAAALQQQQQQHQHVQQQQHHQTTTSAYDTSSISMSIPSPNQNVTGGAGPGSAGPYGGSSSRVKEEASFHTFHYDVGMGGSSMSIDSAANQHQHLLHLDTYNASAQKAAATRHLLGDHSRTGEADMGELQALAHALLRRK